MQLRTYAKKNNLVASEIIEALQSTFTKTIWTLTSELKDSHITLLDQTFGIDNLQPKLPINKEQLKLSGSNSNLDRVQPTGELVDNLKENVLNLTADDVETLRVSVQRQIVEESAELAAFRDFQHYQTTYNTTQRSLVVNDIYQRLEVRNKNREKFQQEQELLVSETITEKSSDLLSGMLEILKADKYQSSFLTSKLEQL